MITTRSHTMLDAQVDVSRYSPSTEHVQLISARYRNFAFPKHFHTDFHFGLVLSGEQKVSSLGCGFVTGPGQIQVMAPGQVHNGETAKEFGFETKIVSISPAFFDQFLLDTQPKQTLQFNSQLIESHHIYNELIALQAGLASSVPFELAIKSQLLTVFSDFVSRYANWQLAKVSKLGSKSSNEVTHFMQDNIGEKITLATLANLCCLSEFTFLRQFKKQFAMTPAAWLAQLRLERAIQLLSDGIEGTEVAHRLGFYDQAHFIKAFKRCYGTTPQTLFK